MSEQAIEDKAPAGCAYFDWAHDGPGWYYWSFDYPDEGSVGAFDLESSAVLHALEAGYLVEAAVAEVEGNPPRTSLSMKARPEKRLTALETDDFHDRNVEAVAKLMHSRAKLGLAEYGCDTTRADFDAVKWLRELQKELLDGAIYCEAAIGRVQALTEYHDSLQSVLNGRPSLSVDEKVANYREFLELSLERPA